MGSDAAVTALLKSQTTQMSRGEPSFGTTVAGRLSALCSQLSRDQAPFLCLYDGRELGRLRTNHPSMPTMRKSDETLSYLAACRTGISASSNVRNWAPSAPPTPQPLP